MSTFMTTLLCLFHHADRAAAALKELTQAGIPRESITTMAARDSNNSMLPSLETIGGSGARYTAPPGGARSWGNARHRIYSPAVCRQSRKDLW